MELAILKSELERAKAALEDLTFMLEDELWLKSTAPSVVNEHRKRAGPLRSELDRLQALIKQATPSASGGLPPNTAGIWVPLPLHDWPSARDGKDEPIALPPIKAPYDGLDARRRQQVFSQIAAVFLQKGPPNDARSQLMELVRPSFGDALALRLLEAAFRSLDGQTAARWVRLRREELTGVAAVSGAAACGTVPPTNWMSTSEGLADSVDGLTQLQRQVLVAMRDVAPAKGALVGIDVAVKAVVSASPVLTQARVRDALISLCHPSLRRIPLVEQRGVRATGGPGEFQVTHVRLSALAEPFLEGALALPLLLINGMEGTEATLPPHNPKEVLEAALLVLEISGPEEPPPGAHLLTVGDIIKGPDFPGGGALHGGHLSELWTKGEGTLRLRARVDAEFEPETARARLVVYELPQCMSSGDFVRELVSIRMKGGLEGVTDVQDISDSTGGRVVLVLEHIAFAGAVKVELVDSGVLEQQWPVRARVLDGGQPTTLSFQTLLERFVSQRKALPSRSLEAAHAELQRRTHLAEAVFVATSLRDAVLAVTRRANDDRIAIAGLMTFLKPVHRSVLTAAPLPLSHGYEKGFTEAQARHLVAVTKLESRNPEMALIQWRSMLDAVAQSEAAMKSDVEIKARVRAELLAARERLGAPRRTRIEVWD